MDAADPLSTALQGWTVLGCGPASFAGAGTIHARTLIQFARAGARCWFVGRERPFLHAALKRHGVSCLVPEWRCDAYPASDAVAMTHVTEELVRLGMLARGRLLLLGTYVFPFFQAVASAAEILRVRGRAPVTVAIPAGSDVLQIGYRTRSVLTHLLSPAHTSLLVTYSARFREEVKRLTEVDTPFEVVPPPIDGRRFRPVSAGARRRRRRSLGIRDADLVLIQCSNMRPVKNLPGVIRIASAVATARADGATLLLVGPVTEHLQRALVRNVDCRLRIVSIGVVADTAPFHAIADVAVNASVHDSFNGSLAESLACGVPVVSSDVVGVGSLVRSRGCGFLFRLGKNALAAFERGNALPLPEREVERAAAFVLRAARDAGYRRRLSALARSAVLAECGPRTFTTKWVQLLRRL